ncbi:hypothetical protein SDRG_17186 [Saprolegnia diclina VS20]|uniref:Multidrug/Oligosaccharidyl-lipid/Polysaccharide (MOP) Flippase Superfamily n=1 Tax=Saprolegnia diclina (strain VS20) TaxID=1156394 RepID=T0QYW2_SAPDV|nr:hypothetical protein SDRG_17186 [Saprolegnia diclina VS20]EQC24928.1 hypothetical protein SDRG_17186 [Saprolegnia diclina VS20]|eukprot:XP_008621645.1 hypothetical protein SDRG_17186 [Saprolegnia diclina VS20]
MTAEAQSLLPRDASPAYAPPPADLEKASAIETPTSTRAEILSLVQLAYPLVATFAMEFLPGFLSVALVGHLNSAYTKEFVDAAALSTVFLNVSGLSIGFGLASAMDTLCSQSVGAGKIYMLGVYLQSGMIVLSLAYIPMVLMNYNTTFFLNLLGQDAMVASLAGEFSRVTVFCLPSLFLYELLKKVLQAQHIVAPMAYIAVASNFIYIAVGYYLCYHTSLGFIGAAYARLVSNSCMPLMVLPYLLWNPVYTTWWPDEHTMSSQWGEAFAHVYEFVTFGVPGMLMMLMEWWAFEMLALMAGWMPNPVLSISVHSVLINLSAMAYSLFLGISVATTIRVGNALGAYEPQRAKAIAKAAYCVSFAAAMFVATFFLATHNVLPAFFINDPSSIAQTQRALFFFVIFEVLDAMNCVAQGILRGMGRQAIGAYVNAMAYYAVGIPVAGVVGFYCELDVQGLWIGIAVGVFSAFCVYSWTLQHTNWRAMADKAVERMTD